MPYRIRSRAMGLTLQDFDFYEIHEAFSGQILCTLAAWENADYCRGTLGLEAPLGRIDRSRLNVNGARSASATRSPPPALASLPQPPSSSRGIGSKPADPASPWSVCAAGGLGATAILEGWAS